MVPEDHSLILRVELRVELLVERHAVSSDFHCINSSLAIKPVMDSVVVELVCLSSKIYSIFGESVVYFGKLAPISSLPCTGNVFVWNNTNVDLLNWVFELVHKHISVCLVDGLLLIFMNAYQREPDSLDIQIVYHRMSEQVICVENH